jgi:hypothetical protein
MEPLSERMVALQAGKVRELPPRPVLLDGLRQIEQSLGEPLPDDYREFVQSWGGTALKPYVLFPLKGNPPFDGHAILDVLFGILPGSGYDLLTQLHQTRDWLASWLLPVAQDPGGNLISLSVRQGEVGSVYYVHRDTYLAANDADPGEWPGLFPVARSWSHFVSLWEFKSPEDIE